MQDLLERLNEGRWEQTSWRTRHRQMTRLFANNKYPAGRRVEVRRPGYPRNSLVVRLHRYSEG